MRLDHCVGSPSQSVFLQQRRLAVRRCRADSFWWDHPIALFLSLARVLCRIYRTVPYGAPRWRIVLADFCPAPRGLRAFIHTHIHVLGRALLTTIHRAQYIRLVELACVNSILSCYLTLSPPPSTCPFNRSISANHPSSLLFFSLVYCLGCRRTAFPAYHQINILRRGNPE